MNDKKSGINPHIDLRASNNMLNIHTCADSGRALLQLLTYYANDGDITTPSAPVVERSPYSSPRHQADQELSRKILAICQKSQHEHVNDLLDEAMQETEVVTGLTEIFPATGAKLFFFPDEHHQLPQEPPGETPQLVTCELGEVPYSTLCTCSDTDDEFCFVGNEAGLGLFPKSGLPEIKWLTSDPVRVVDNHFSIPVGKTDLLKPPKNFPIPIMRYTLCEMTVVWHMYGGNDFKVPDKDSKKKTVNFSDTHLSDSISFSNTGRGEVNIGSNLDKKKANIPWILRGGVNRDHSVLMELQLNKVRFQHELYPEMTTQASRQVLIVSEVEIRDRLESSQINKFLYEYTSQARPKQSHAHMVVIKALHIRPDPKLKTQECCLKISLLPLRLNIDQDSLLFLIQFFNELGGGKSVDTDEIQQPSSKHSTPTHQPPVMTISQENDILIKHQARKWLTTI
ncbi:hypothetical protein NQ317_015422 [Molorchus minor]|uniref:Autophagy-related protein 2 n=1 Tax=Molorchus minor TaxID=1323400 RepID=A0ABQ9IWY0_9CUCU|nr:hypothetical protein NQ317_015422 [Molorchus minor]